MLPKAFFFKAVIAATVFVTACSILTKEDPDKAIREFLTFFNASLTKPDTEILALFETAQSHNTLLAALRVLQNKESKFITCQLALPQATIVRRENEVIEVSVPVMLATKDLAEDFDQTTSLTLVLTPKDQSFVITKLEGEQFYQAYTALKNSSEWAVERQEELERREPIYAMARAIDVNVDSVIWYAVYNGKKYFYAVEGNWRNYFIETDGYQQPADEYVMGMVDSIGTVIIPFSYELIGTIAFEEPALVEVKQGGKFGYFDIENRKLVVEPVYDMIIPYKKDSVWAIVKTDTTYGWLNTSFAYREGFPSDESMTWTTSYKYLAKEIMLKQGNQVFCEIPNKENAGYGIIIPPSYFVKNNLFDPIVGGVNTTKVPMSGWTDYLGAKQSIVQQIGHKFHALITVVEERYLGGREEFYGESKVVFVNNNSDIMGITKVPTDKEIIISLIDSTLVEVEALSSGYWYNAPGRERNIPYYSYFRIRGGFHLMPLTTNRRYSFTEFIKLDSNYITGDFQKYVGYTPGEGDEDGEAIYEDQAILSAATLGAIRNEILASYGMRFNDSRVTEEFSKNWYNPRYDTIEEFSDKLTDIDRHNLAFLEKIIALMEGGV